MGKRLKEEEPSVPETPADFGSETELTSQDEQIDIIDEAVWGLMDEVIANGFSEDQAEKKVRSAVEKLVKDELITDLPEYSATDGNKARWIANAVPSVRNWLALKGDLI